MTSRPYKLFTHLFIIVVLVFLATRYSPFTDRPVKQSGKTGKVIDTLVIIDGDTLFQYETVAP